jgi:hypothetical protein
MSRLVGFVFLTVACLSAQPSSAAESDKIHGVWKLVSYEVEVQATGQIGPVMGGKPTGHAAFLPEGRVFFVLTGEARKPGKTDKERASPRSTWPGTRNGSAPNRSGLSSWSVSDCKC